MNEEAEETIKAALEAVDYYHDWIVAEMREARADALNKGIDYEFDVKLLSRFVGAVEALAETSTKKEEESWNIK